MQSTFMRLSKEASPTSQRGEASRVTYEVKKLRLNDAV